MLRAVLADLAMSEFQELAARTKMTKERLAYQLGLNPSTVGRWLRSDADRKLPALDNYLASLVFFKCFSPVWSRPTWLYDIASTLMVRIRSEDLDGSDKEISIQQFLCVHWYLRHPEFQSFLNDPENFPAESIYLMERQVVQRVQSTYPAWPGTSRELRKTVREWQDAYILVVFAFEYAFNWKLIDDDALRQSSPATGGT